MKARVHSAFSPIDATTKTTTSSSTTNSEPNIDLRSAKTLGGSSAFADQVSSSAAPRHLAGLTTPAKAWNSADELHITPKPLVSHWLSRILLLSFLFLALLCLNQIMSTHVSANQKPPTLSVAETNVLSKYELVFLLDHTNSMANVFDCPLGSESRDIITSRSDFAQRHLGSFRKQAENSLPDGFTIINIERILWPLNSVSFADIKHGIGITGFKFGLQKAAEGRKQCEKPLALVVLTDGNFGNQTPQEQEIIEQELVNSSKMHSNLKLVFVVIGNDQHGWSTLNKVSSENSSVVTCVPFSKLKKSGLARELTAALP